MSGSITEIASNTSNVFAFRLSGEVTDTDLEVMAEQMLDAFETFDKVNMLLIFDGYEGSETFSSLQANVMKAQTKALAKVDKYAVVNAPDLAEFMIEVSDTVMPVHAETFEAHEIARAWAFVGAEPIEGLPT